MKLIVGNQKSYLSSTEIDIFIEKLSNIQRKDNVLICPSSIYIDRFVSSGFVTGCQNVSKYKSGAYTGELSVEQIKSVGVSFAIVGHSEVRKNFNESIIDTNTKIIRLLDEEIVPILCVGESKEERDEGRAKDIVLEQIEGAFEDLSPDLVKKVLIAYEPIWAIGTGEIPTNDDIQDMVSSIKEYLIDNYDVSGIILYGGSVNNENIDELNEIDNIDGYLIGGASTKVYEFLQIIDKCEN